MYKSKKIRFRPDELEKLKSMKRKGETDREFFLRLAKLDTDEIKRGQPSHRNYLTDVTRKPLAEAVKLRNQEDFERRQAFLVDDADPTSKWRNVRCTNCGTKYQTLRAHISTCPRCGCRVGSYIAGKEVTTGTITVINPHPTSQTLKDAVRRNQLSDIEKRQDRLRAELDAKKKE